VQQAADATRFRAVVDFNNSMQQAAQSWTAEKNYERDGGDTAPAVQPVPTIPANFPPTVPPGIVPRFRAIIRRLNNMKPWTEAMAAATGVLGSQKTAPDFTSVQPVITLTLQGNTVLIGWGWQGYSDFLDMLELQVDRGDGKGWVFLTYDTTPNYTDTTPLPATPTKWKYRGIYRVGDAQVGIWSSEMSITVGG
jgi:hypothetical protein